MISTFKKHARLTKDRYMEIFIEQNAKILNVVYYCWAYICTTNEQQSTKHYAEK